MNILGFICFAALISSVFLFMIKKYRHIIFGLYPFFIAISISKLIGTQLGNFLFSDILKIRLNNISDTALANKVRIFSASTLGTVTAFITLLFILKKIFLVVEGKMEASVYIIVIDRLYGALIGMLFNNVFAVAVSEIAITVFSAAYMFKQASHLVEYEDNTSVFRFIRNLN